MRQGRADDGQDAQWIDNSVEKLLIGLLIDSGLSLKSSWTRRLENSQWCANFG